MKVLVVTIGNISTEAYPEVERRLPFLTFIRQPFPMTTFPVVKYGKYNNQDWYGLDFSALRESIRTDAELVQVLFDYRVYAPKLMFSCSIFALKDQQQFSQVIYPTIWTEPVHELLHSLQNYYGLPDTLHEEIAANSQLAEAGFRAILDKLEPYLNQVKVMNPLFPLKRRIPTFRTGFNTWRTDPRNGRRFQHKAQDYRAVYEPVFAHEDCLVTSFKEYLGGLWAVMDGKEYTLRLAHLSKVVKTGQVKRGEQVGVSGNSGALTTGPHLHLEATYKITNSLMDPEAIAWDDERNEDMLIRNSAGEISYLSQKGIRHPVSARAYADYFDSGSFVQVTDDFYNVQPAGKPFASTVAFGSLGKVEEVIQ